MTFEQYWALLAKRWQLIAICFVVVGLGTFIVSKLLTPLYQSAVLVQIDIRSGNNVSDINGLLASDQLVQTEAQLAVGDPILRAVASQYPGLTVQQLAGEVSSAPRVNTQLFEIDVLDASSGRAASLANAIADTLISKQLQTAQQENKQAQQTIQQDIAATQQQINDVSNKIATLQAQGASRERIGVLQNQLSGLQQNYNQWETSLSQLVVAQGQSGDFLRVAQPAQPALSPAQPNVKLNTVGGLVAGLLLGMLLAVLFEQLDTHVHSPEELSELLNWTVLGTVWRSRSTDRREMINPQGHDSNAESYRILRTNVGFSGIDSPLRTLMLTSPTPGDGKSTITANLAIFMAKAGKNTLLIDADLRRPTQHEIFNLGADKQGLSNAVLAFSAPASSSNSVAATPQFVVPTSPDRFPGASLNGQAGLQQFIHAVGIPNLRVMPSGPLPPNPSELLDSKAMESLFKALQNCGAEVVIFDTPPILGLSDARILASKVDGVLIVADMMRANKKHLKQVKELLAQSGAHVLGCIMNKQRHGHRNQSYSYYYYYYRSNAQGHDDERGTEDGGTAVLPVSVPVNARAGRSHASNKQSR